MTNLEYINALKDRLVYLKHMTNYDMLRCMPFCVVRELISNMFVQCTGCHYKNKFETLGNIRKVLK